LEGIRLENRLKGLDQVERRFLKSQKELTGFIKRFNGIGLAQQAIGKREVIGILPEWVT